MKVLHLPVNVASVPSHIIKALQIIGVEAKGLIWKSNVIQDSTGLATINISSPNRFEKIYKQIIYSRHFFKLVHWADIIHWHFGRSILPWDLDVNYIKIINKPAIVQWHGSDIRIPEVEFKDNPFYRRAFPSACPSKQYKNSILK